MSSHVGSKESASSPHRSHRMYAALALLLTGYFSMALLTGLLDPRPDLPRKKTAATPAVVTVAKLQP